ncbi:MAG: TerB family tellurite resistance protein [Rhodospirillales bacterium]
MSIWGKVIGGAAGFAIGGPLGALMGAAFGHSFDRMKREDAQGAGAGPSAGGRDNLQVLFTTSIVVLGAKLAKADGRVTPDEIAAFKQVFNIPPEDMAAVGRIFDEAKGDAAGFEPYAEQIAAIFRTQPAVLEQLLTALFRIAMADGVYHGAERAYLVRVAQIFGFSEAAFARIETMFTQGAGAENPYAVLDLDQNASDSEVKSRYRELIREHHPDRLTAQGMPEEFVAQANDKMAAINAAYDTIEKQRGLK